MNGPSHNAAPPAEPALHLQGLSCTLGTRAVLRDLSTAPLAAGQLTAVLGRNGVGKSTLLRCIAGFVPCSATQMELGGRDLRPMRAADRALSVRYLPQAAPGTLHLTVRDALRVALHASARLPPAQARERIRYTAHDLGLETLLDRYLDELSGGQKQLVWLAQALLHRPHALLLDEPLAALDPNHQHHVMSLLQRLAREQDLIVLIVLHDLNMALRYSDAALILDAGRAVAQGTPARALQPDILKRAFLVEARIETCSRGIPFVMIDKHHQA